MKNLTDFEDILKEKYGDKKVTPTVTIKELEFLFKEVEENLDQKTFDGAKKIIDEKDEKHYDALYKRLKENKE